MMKKIIPMAAVTIAAMLSGQAIAGNFAGPGATTISPATGAAMPCASLSNDVSIQLSKGVFAGYTCADVTTFNVATCHQNGTNKSQTVACTYSNKGTADVPNWQPSDDQCPAYDPLAAAQATSATFVGRVAFQGASGGGTVSSVNLRGTTCDGATVENLTK